MGVIITKFPFLLPHVSLAGARGQTGSGDGPDTIDFDFRRRDFRGRQPELGARADLGETDETAPAAHGTDSADT